MSEPLDAAALLAGLNAAQREAVEAVRGPVVILAGAGTGKTRVLTRRVAYAAATGAADPRRALVVTFAARAATEMLERLRALGVRGATARTFHAAALDQLRYFWPRLSETDFPGILESKARLLVPLVGRERPPFRFTPVKDVADAIEWASIRRVQPAEVAAAAAQAGRPLPLPDDVLRRVWSAYERAKQRTGVMDFEDMLVRTVELLETDEDAARLVRARYTWFSVDEYQDTNLLQEQLLAAWLGDRRDLCVVGDPDQTIYTFTGASSEYLAGFDRRFPDARVIELAENYRSTPQVLAVGNRLASPSRGGGPRLVATVPAGPAPRLQPHADEDAELGTLVATIRSLTEAERIAPSEIAILVRTNAQVAPIEAALTRAAIPYQVRGERFWARRDVRDALAAVRSAASEVLAARPSSLAAALAERWAAAAGYEPDALPETEAARERQAMFETLLAIAGETPSSAGDRPASMADFLAEASSRDLAERDGAADGVVLSTIHRAKGLEWDAVLLPAFEEGFIPHAAAVKSDAGEAEERRLAYVAVTRARRYLFITWTARRRVGKAGRESARQPSRFLSLIADRRPGVADARAPGRPAARRSARTCAPGSMPPPADSPLVAALKEWRRERARAQGVPAYVVVDDATIGEIAAARPRTAIALGRVRGIGPKRVEQYGDEILEIVRAGG